MASLVAADGPSAFAALSALPAHSLDDARRSARQCILARLSGAEPASGSGTVDTASLALPVAKVLEAYRTYWNAMLMKRASAEQAQRSLQASLAAAGAPAPAAADLDAQTQASLDLVRRHGLHGLGGVTPPLHELMLWRRQHEVTEPVVLPDGPMDIPVTRLEEFVSLGWLAHATCDRHHSGGWVAAEGVMVVASAWDTSSEAYRVSLLAHEAQHLADRRRFPALDAADLEYRAKLVELALADRTQRDLVEAFVAQARPDRASPHAFASHWLVQRLHMRTGSADLAAVAPSVLRSAALAELEAHTRALSQLGASLVRTALPE